MTRRLEATKELLAALQRAAELLVEVRELDAAAAIGLERRRCACGELTLNSNGVCNACQLRPW